MRHEGNRGTWNLRMTWRVDAVLVAAGTVFKVLRQKVGTLPTGAKDAKAKALIESAHRPSNSVVLGPLQGNWHTTEFVRLFGEQVKVRLT